MRLFIFGSTGDLVKRKVLPALQALDNDKLEIYALGRKDFTDEIYRDFVCSEVRCNVNFRKNLYYYKVDIQNLDETFDKNLLDKNGKNYFYVALPPNEIDNIINFLIELDGMYDFSVLIEKPFGDSLKSANELKRKITEAEIEDRVFLCDHYLFKEAILNMNKVNFKELKIVSKEKVGLEGRNTYYDGVGALKDMVQSHFLNTVYKLIDDPKKEFYDFDVKKFERGQYEGYKEELGKESDTETYIDLVMNTKNHKYSFITGKSFNTKESFIEIDGKKIDMNTGKDAYESAFKEFFKGKKDNFATIDNSILSWKIIDKLTKKLPNIQYYKKG